MNSKGMFYTNVSDYETKEDMMNDFIALRMYDMAKDKEIERLKDLCNKYEEEHKTAFEEWKKAINIIKEVREKIESVQLFGLRSGKTLIATLLNDILKILDKENSNE